jgi:UDP-N-acetylmuramoylalanine--D-glutamate ligase
MNHLRDLPVLVFGLGASGLAMARWCARHGARVTVADTRAAPPQLAALRQELPDAAFVAGPFDAALLAASGARAVYRSPGLAPAAIAPVADAAAAAGLPIGGELDLFARALADLRTQAQDDANADADKGDGAGDGDGDNGTDASVDGGAAPSGLPAARTGYAPAVLAITGTNGKTTVTALTGLLVERAGRSVAVAGNIGPTLLDTLAAHLDAGTLPDAWVLELSSFQLDGARGFAPTAGAVLNLSEDHLDWHGGMDAYAAAKARIFAGGGLPVLNRDDPQVMALRPAPAAPAAGPAARGRARAKAPPPAPERPYVTFGAGLPRRPGDFGIETVGGMAWLVRAHDADALDGAARRGRRALAVGAGADADEGLPLQRLMPADALRIRGRHNALNALAALALAQAAGCALAPMLHGLREYRGEPHRVETVAILDGVEYVDDSKGTNVGATVAAIAGLAGEGGRRIVAILGGEGKGQDFAPLAAPLARHGRAAVLIGRDAPAIAAAIAGAGVPLERAATLEAAVDAARRLAASGDVVLLSPACASFDMFDDYAHRARVFCGAVAALAADAGAVLEGGSA